MGGGPVVACFGFKLQWLRPWTGSTGLAMIRAFHNQPLQLKPLKMEQEEKGRDYPPFPPTQPVRRGLYRPLLDWMVR